MSPTTPPAPALFIGIDGGATHTVALLADAASGALRGRGEAGPSNIQAVGVEAALRELDAAVGRAFASREVRSLRVSSPSRA